jgi:amino acid transporter
LAILTPTAAYPVFGVAQQVSNGHAALSYLLAMGAMLFTAASYGKMAQAFPAAGSTYTYAQQALHPYVGFLAGWSMILDYVLVPLLSAVFVSLTAARLVPQVPYIVWAGLFCGAVTLTNIRGIEVTKRANALMLAVMSVSAVLFIAACIAYTMNGMVAGALFNSRALFDPSSFRFSALLSGASIATLSYLGFDAVSTLAEDARDPQRDIGFATIAVCIIQTVICFLIVYLAAVVWPDYHRFTNVETAILDISQLAGGPALFGVTTLVLLVAAIASSIASQAGASRLLFGMGRDRMLPAFLFGYIHPKYSTPTRSIALMGAISFVGAQVISFQLVVELVNFGAFVGFILVNLSVIAHYFVRMRMRSGIGVIWSLLLPTAGAIVCTGVWLSLSYHAKTVGFAWLAIGILYLAILTKGFSRPVRVLELP